MTLATAPIKSVMFNILCGLLLCGCHVKAGDQSAAAQLPAAEASDDNATVNKETPAPKPDYWKAIAPLVAGSYGGDCLGSPDFVKITGDINLSADGRATWAAGAVNMRESEIVQFHRQREDDGQVSASFMASERGGEGMVTLLARGAGNGNSASIARGASGMSCEKSADMTRLIGKDFDRVRDMLFSSPKRTIHCLSMKTMKAENAEYQFADGTIRLQNDRYVLNTAKQEILMLHNGASALSFSVVTTDGRHLNVIFDEQGQLKHIDAMRKDGPLYACDREL